MITQGIADAKACIALGPGGCQFNFEKSALKALNERKTVHRHRKEKVTETVGKLEL